MWTLGSESDRRLRYGSPWVLAASELPLDRGIPRTRTMARFIAAATLRPRRFAALIVLILRIRCEYVVLSEARTGQALDRYFNQRRLGVFPAHRLCRGVLLLPRDHADYLRGRHRQALRTNLRKAVAAGIQCEVVTDPHCAVDDSDALRRQWSPVTDALGYSRALVAQPEMTVVVARDRHGQPLAIAAAVVDDTVCLIMHALAACHEARWALHDYLVQMLIARRVRYVLAEGGGVFGALGFTNGTQHYQRLLGYELRHVVPVRQRRAKRARRLLASLLAVAASGAIIPPAVAESATAASVNRTRLHPAARAAPPVEMGRTAAGGAIRTR